MAPIPKYIPVFVLLPVLLAWASAVASFPFCFSADDNNRHYSSYYYSSSSYYPYWPRAGYWLEDYPPIPYSRTLEPADVEPVIVQEAESPAPPVAIPAQHIFR